MTTVVLAPHPDDEAIGCGGTLALLADTGERIVVAFLTSGELGLPQLAVEDARRCRESEAERAAPLLGIERLLFLRQPDWGLAEHVGPALAALRELLADEDVRRLYLPHLTDEHPDHAAAATVGQRWAGSHGPEVELRSYEVWTPLSRWDLVEDISGVMDRKLAAVAAYASQDYYDYVQAATGLSAYRGALATRTSYAEVFAQVPVEQER